MVLGDIQTLKQSRYVFLKIFAELVAVIGKDIPYIIEIFCRLIASLGGSP